MGIIWFILKVIATLIGVAIGIFGLAVIAYSVYLIWDVERAARREKTAEEQES